METEPAKGAPLAGVVVLELARLLPGPLASNLLLLLGAEVIKVEDLGAGDYMRLMLPTVEGLDGEPESTLFRMVNAGKRSVQVDMKTPEGRRVIEGLVEDVDVVVDSFRPGVLDRLGLGVERLMALNPRLVVCSVTGYGTTGPLSAAAGHDLGYLARAGLLPLSHDVQGRMGPMPIPLADIGGGTYPALAAILAALFARERTGTGTVIDAAILDGTMPWGIVTTAPQMVDPDLQGPQPASEARFNAYECTDGWVTLSAIEEKFWHAFCSGVERPDLLEHHNAPIGSWAHGELQDIFRGRSRDDWEAFNAEHDCCVDPVLSPLEAVQRADASGRGSVYRTPSGEYRFGLPARFVGYAAPQPDRPEPLGTSTFQVLKKHGFSEAEISDFVAAGAVRLGGSSTDSVKGVGT